MLENEQIEWLFWVDLVRRDPVTRFRDTYTKQKIRLEELRTEEEVAAEVARLAHLGSLYRLMWHPEEEEHAAVRRQLRRLLDWGATVTDHPVLQLLVLRDKGEASSEEIAQAMLLIESYLVRRILAGRASQGVNRQLAGLANELYENKSSELADVTVHTYLTRQVRQYVSDHALRVAASTSAFYYSGRANQRKQVLLWLEELFNSQEHIYPADLTIEHVMPQTLSAQWREHIADAYGNEAIAEQHTSLVHALGNLTLTGYNAPQSNRPFEEKRNYLRGTSLKMSQEIGQEAKWTFAEIQDRTDRLIERAIQHWPGPLEDVSVEDKTYWVNLRFILAELPSGSWTTYGALATAIGIYAQSVGNYLDNQPVPNPHRVLKSDGTVSPNSLGSTKTALMTRANFSPKRAWRLMKMAVPTQDRASPWKTSWHSCQKCLTDGGVICSYLSTFIALKSQTYITSSCSSSMWSPGECAPDPGHDLVAGVSQG